MDERILMACATFGAGKIYDAANARLSGDHSQLTAFGLTAKTLGDANKIASIAYANMGPVAQAIDYAQATAQLDRLK